jgi:thioredoxin 1
VAPAQLGADRLRAVFAQYAVAGDAASEPLLTPQALASMLKALGVTLPGAETEGDVALRRVFSALDDDGSGGITFAEFASWWDAQVRPAGEEGPVQLVVSAEELEALLAEETPGKLVCLEVGMTFCRPCKAFEKTYKAVAAETPSARFLRLNGNENRSCTALARDVLGVRSTPAFYFFRAGPPAPGAPPGLPPPVDSHTGANEQRLRDAVTRLLAPPAAAEPGAPAAAAAAAPAPPPRVEAGKIDVSDAKKSGLAELLGKLSIKQAYLDKLRAQVRNVEKELAELQDELEKTTGHPRKQGPGR